MGIKQILSRFSKIPSPVDKFLWLLVVLLVAGFFTLRFFRGNLPGRDTTLVFAQWWEEELDTPVLAELAAEFAAKNPGIRVTLENKSWPEILESLEKPGAGGVSPPDIFSLNPYWLDTLERESLLAPLESAGDSPQTYAAPVISFMNLLYYNIDLIKKAGYDRPPKSQTEFLSYVQGISQAGQGVYGAGLALGNQDPQSVDRHLLSWIWAAAGSPAEAVSPGTETPEAGGPEPGEPGQAEDFTFDSPRVIAALTFLNQLYQNLYPGPFTMTEEDLFTAFSEGRVGMIIGPSSGMGILKNTMEGKFGVTTIPSAESYARNPVFTLSGWYAGIYSKSPRQEEARKFMALLKEKTKTLAAAARAVPGGGERLSPEQSKNDPYYAKAFDMYEVGERVNEFYGNRVLNSAVRRETGLMFNGSKTPEQCARAIQQSWEDTRKGGRPSAAEDPGALQ